MSSTSTTGPMRLATEPPAASIRSTAFASGWETLRTVGGVESAADDLRRAGKITGDLVFTPDENAQEISVSAELAEVPAGNDA